MEKEEGEEKERWKGLGFFFYFNHVFLFDLKNNSLFYLITINKCHKFVTSKNCYKILKFGNLHFFSPKTCIFQIYDTVFTLQPQFGHIFVSLNPIFVVVILVNIWCLQIN